MRTIEHGLKIIFKWNCLINKETVEEEIAIFAGRKDAINYIEKLGADKYLRLPQPSGSDCVSPVSLETHCRNMILDRYLMKEDGSGWEKDATFQEKVYELIKN